MPDSLEYVTNINNDIMLMETEPPDFHLKTSLEDFQTDTGIRWNVNQLMVPKEKGDKEDTKKSSNKKEIKASLSRHLKKEFEENKKDWVQIANDIVQYPEYESLGVFGKDQKYFSNWYNRNKDLAQ